MPYDPDYEGYISRTYNMHDMLGPMGPQPWVPDFACYLQLLHTICQQKLQSNSDYYNRGRNAF
jgi:hypothetical protein